MSLVLAVQAPEQVITAADAGQRARQAQPCHIQGLAAGSGRGSAAGSLNGCMHLLSCAHCSMDWRALLLWLPGESHACKSQDI